MKALSRNIRLPNLLAVLATLAILVYAGGFAIAIAVSDLIYFSTQREMAFWGVDGRKPDNATLDMTEQSMTAALAWWPGHPDYLALMARIHAWRNQTASNRTVAVEEAKLAIAFMKMCLESRPGNPYSWAQYAELLSLRRDKVIEMKYAIVKVSVLGKGDVMLQQRMRALKAP